MCVSVCVSLCVCVCVSVCVCVCEREVRRRGENLYENRRETWGETQCFLLPHVSFPVSPLSSLLAVGVSGNRRHKGPFDSINLIGVNSKAVRNVSNTPAHTLMHKYTHIYTHKYSHPPTHSHTGRV